MIDGLCPCYRHHEQRAICKNDNLLEIPQDFRETVTILNFDDNSITDLKQKHLQRYKNVSVLSLRRNAIQQLNDNELNQVKNLKRM